jgi:hypothetical protein
MTPVASMMNMQVYLHRCTDGKDDWQQLNLAPNRQEIQGVGSSVGKFGDRPRSLAGKTCVLMLAGKAGLTGVRRCSAWC